MYFFYIKCSLKNKNYDTFYVYSTQRKFFQLDNFSFPFLGDQERYRQIQIYLQIQRQRQRRGSSSLSLPNLRLLIFVTLYTLPNLRLLATLYNLRLLATLYNLRLLATLYNLRLLEEEDEDSLEFLRMNHFPSVYTSPLSMLDLALTLLSTISLCQLPLSRYPVFSFTCIEYFSMLDICLAQHPFTFTWYTKNRRYTTIFALTLYYQL